MKSFKDLTGMRFGKLTVLRSTGKKGKSGVIWECKCDCGNVHYAGTYTLTNGHTQSCGCKRKSEFGRKLSRNLTGQRFGRLTVVCMTGDRDVNGGLMWECKCDCGKTTFVRGSCLISGDSRSCGCMRGRKRNPCVHCEDE